MNAGTGCRAFRAACAALLLAVPCLGDSVSDDAAPLIRRVFVSAAAPDSWPAGHWEPILLADLERELAVSQQDQVESFVTGLEHAEYRARLVGDTLQNGTFEWKLRPSPGQARFLPLDPLNLAISHLEWIDADNGKAIGPVIWGTTRSQTAGLVRQSVNGLAAGAWSLAGRGLARSTEFEVRVPPAIVSHFEFQVPDGLIPTTTAGELAGPRGGAAPGFSSWELHLGSRTTCRLRFSPPIAETARRPLVVARSRTSYEVRPEVVRVFAVFDLEVYETAVSELRLQIDEGVQVINVEYGDNDEVAWRVVDGSDGRAIIVRLPDSLTGSGKVLRVHGISPGKALQAWAIPRLYLPDAVESEAEVTVLLHPPYQAADLRMDGYRQVELIASPTDGETVTLRQLKAGASLVVVPSSPRLAAMCHSVTLARLEGEEWALTAMMDLHSTAGGAFKVLCRVPEGWEIVDVQSDSESGSGDLTGWDIVTADGGEIQLQLDFLTALSPTRPQRVRVTARRDPIGIESELPVPGLICPDAVEVDAVSIIIDGPDHRPVLQRSEGWDVSTLADLSPADQSLDFVRGLPATTRMSAVVLRTSTAHASGTLMLRGLDRADLPRTRVDVGGAVVPFSTKESMLKVESIKTPIVAILGQARVALEGAEIGFDRYQVDFAVSGSEGAELNWVLPEIAEETSVRLDDRPVEPQTAGAHRMLRMPATTIGNRGRYNLALEYRVPCSLTSGPNRRRVVLPQIPHPVLQCRLKILVPRRLRLVGPPAGIEVFPDVGETQSIFGPLARLGTDSLFHPFKAADWRGVWEQFDETGHGSGEIIATAAGGRDPESVRLSNQQRSHAEAIGETWTGSTLTIPDKLELTVWEREQAESVSWVIFWLSLLTTVALRMAALPGRRLTATFAVAVLTGAVWVLPPLYSQISGTALVAIAIGALLPRRFLLWRHPIAAVEPQCVPGGSTRSFATASFLSILATLSLAYVCLAQDDRPARADVQLRRPPGSRERIDVLIPTGPDGRPTGVTPLCYVSADVIDRLQRLQLNRGVPPYLLNAVAINATVAEGRQAEIRASFDVYVLSEEDSVRVELPLTNVVLGGANACLVNGRPHPILLGSDGRGLAVELAGRSDRPSPVSLPTPEPESTQKPPAAETPTLARNSDTSVLHRIELRLHPHVELESNETFIARLGIPMVSDTSVEFTAKAESVALSAAPRNGEAAQIFKPDLADRERVVARLRPTGELQFRWSRSRPASQAAAVELTAYVNGLIDVTPELVYSTYRVEYQVHAGTIDALAWKLPRGATLVSVQSPGMSGYVLESGEGDVRRLFLEFAAPQTGSIVVTALLAQPSPRGAVEFDLPLLELDTTPDRAGHTTLGRYQVAFRQAVDFRLKVAASGPNQALKPRAVDDFLKSWPVVGARPPQQAYELIRTGDLKLSLQELGGGLTAKTESRGRFGKGRLDWTFLAEIAPPVVPPFQYRLHVDRRLRIRKVSVQEDGAEQLLRWSQIDDTLVLFLNNRAVRSQKLEIDATLPIPDSSEVELPSIELEGVPVGPRYITLTHAPDVRVTPLGEGPANADDVSSLSVQKNHAGESPPAGRIEIAADRSSRRFLVQDSIPDAKAEIATILRRVGNGNILTTAVDYKVESGRVLQFEMELPAELAQRGRIETSVAAEIVRHSVAEGRTTLMFFPLQPITDGFRVTLKVPAVVPLSGDWTVPRVDAIGVQTATRSLILANEYSVDLESSLLPDWIPALFDSEFDIARVACYSLPIDESATSIRLSNVVQNKVSPDALADVTIDLDTDGALTGRYVLWLPRRPPDEIVFDWLPNANLLAVFVDDRPQSVPAPANGVIAIPLPVDAPRALICLTWTERGTPPIGTAGKLRSKLPVPQNVPVATTLLTTRLPPRLFARYDADRVQELEFALVRWQAVLSAIERPSTQPEGDGRSWLAACLRKAAAQATRLATEEIRPSSSPERWLIEMLGRRTALLKLGNVNADGRAVESFANVLSGEPPESDQHSVGSTAPWISKAVLARIDATTKVEGVWVFDRLAVNGLMGSLIAFIVGLIVWKTAPIWIWLERRETLAWVFLGLFWWLVFKSVVFGLVLIVWGLLEAVRRAMRRPRIELDFLQAAPKP